MSLHGQFMYDRDDAVGNTDIGNASAEHTVSPIEDLNFVPFVCSQLDCSNCRSVWDVFHESGLRSYALIETLHPRSRGAIKFLGSTSARLLAAFVYFLEAHRHCDHLHCIDS
ncbi:hypothetical protein HU200_010575 [Digitaria exilis]|uniref:Uncharacterized protein n=1 Tax=Digitaria exilis TaxID=1010633 RepID=A0A835FHN4_9POAL|nr:hypothetical protein HU200_010575 [Digitaria exilis]